MYTSGYGFIFKAELLNYQTKIVGKIGNNLNINVLK